MIGVIINPQSGHGKGIRVWQQIQPQLDNQHLSFVFRFTTQPLDASEIAIALIEQQAIDLLIVIGGDGTLHEVADGLWRCVQRGRRCELGFIPAGTGNDFAKAHSIPLDPLAAMEICLNPNRQMVSDIIVDQGSRAFVALNSIGVGFDGLVAKRMGETKSKRVLNRLGLGRLSYFMTMFVAFWTYRPTTVWITIDGSEQELADTWFVVTTNIAYFGGGMQICPPARADDGWLDVVVVQSKTRLRLLPIMIAVYSGKHVGHPAVNLYRGLQVSVRAHEPLHAQADGEAALGTPRAVMVAPAALTLRA